MTPEPELAPASPHQPEPPALPEMPRKPRRMGLILSLIGVSVTLVIVASAGAFWAFDPWNAFGRHDRLSIEPPDPLRAHRANLQNTLDARAKALLDGDETGWLGAIDPDNSKLVARQGRLYATLTEMGVARYEHVIRGTTGLPGGSNTLGATIAVRYCFGEPDCAVAESETHLTLRQTDGGGLLVAKYEPEAEIRPWEVSDLRVRTGNRVVVVAEPKHAGRIAAVRRQADLAARRAERFAPDGEWAGKQVLALGGPKKAGDWYDGSVGDMHYGYAYSFAPHDGSEITAVEHMLRVDNIKAVELPFVISWHLGYAAANLGTGETDMTTWWLVNGIAEEMSWFGGNPKDLHEGSEMRALLKQWNGDLSAFHPSYNVDGEAYWKWQSGAHAAVHRLIKKYGEKKFIAFFNAVARDDVDYDDAADKHLGKSLDKVEADVRKYLRSF